MSFAKAAELMILANAAAAQSSGVTLDWIAERFDVSHRTAQRMTQALEETFQNVEVLDGEDRRRRWRIVSRAALELHGQESEALEALDQAMVSALKEGRISHRHALENLKHALLARMPRGEARRAEVEAEALGEGQLVVARPGPAVALDEAVVATVKRAILGMNILMISYGSGGKERRLKPYGILLGPRAYLLAESAGEDRKAGLRSFRLDKIRSASVEAEIFERDPQFSLADYAAGAFGAFHTPDEYGEVVWKFTPQAADRAAEFSFHPKQTSERLSDGSLVVRFWASGHLEMAWHLYQWGDQVEVLAPKALRKMVKKHRRSDFVALP